MVDADLPRTGRTTPMGPRELDTAQHTVQVSSGGSTPAPPTFRRVLIRVTRSSRATALAVPHAAPQSERAWTLMPKRHRGVGESLRRRTSQPDIEILESTPIPLDTLSGEAQRPRRGRRNEAANQHRRRISECQPVDAPKRRAPKKSQAPMNEGARAILQRAGLDHPSRAELAASGAAEPGVGRDLAWVERGRPRGVRGYGLERYRVIQPENESTCPAYEDARELRRKPIRPTLFTLSMGANISRSLRRRAVHSSYRRTSAPPTWRAMARSYWTTSP